MYSRKQIIAKLCVVYEQMDALGPIGDLILSVDRNVYDSKEANKKYRSFVINVLRNKFIRGFRVITRSSADRVHIHCAVQLPEVMTGFDWRSFDQAERWYNLYKLTKDRACLKHYKAFCVAYRKSMSSAFLALHKFIKIKARTYGFGHAKLLPVRKNSNSFKYYLVGNIPRNRRKSDRFLHYFSCWGIKPPTQFKVLTRGYNEYRRRLSLFCAGLGLNYENHKKALVECLGTGWHWKSRNMIDSIDNLGSQQVQYDDLRTSVRQYLIRSDQL